MKRMFRIYASALLIAGALGLSMSSLAVASAQPGPTNPVKTIEIKLDPQEGTEDRTGVCYLYNLAAQFAANVASFANGIVKHEAAEADGGILCRRVRALYD